MVRIDGLLKDQEDREEEKKGRPKLWVALIAMAVTPIIMVVGFWWSISSQVAVLQKTSDATSETLSSISMKLDGLANVTTEVSIRQQDQARRLETIERTHERGGR